MEQQEFIKLNIIKLIERLISIIKQQIEYSELLQNINDLKEKIIINVYEQNHDSNISMLDFTNTEELWNEGYTMSNVNIYYDILSKGSKLI